MKENEPNNPVREPDGSIIIDLRPLDIITKYTSSPEPIIGKGARAIFLLPNGEIEASEHGGTCLNCGEFEKLREYLGYLNVADALIERGNPDSAVVYLSGRTLNQLARDIKRKKSSLANHCKDYK